MNWRDELCQDSKGMPFFMTCMDIVNDELDEAYCSMDVVHTIVNAWVSFGAKVGTA